MGKANGRKAVFITGAASGIGHATATLFVEKGWFVGAYDRNGELLSAAAAKWGAENCMTGVLDVTDRTAFAAALKAFAAETDGRLDLFYSNAGIGRGGPFADQPWEEVEEVVRVNLLAVLSGIHLALPLLKATPNSLCFSTSSSSATYGMGGIAVYSATKHAVKGFTEALAVELKGTGVRVADTLPGLIDTPILPPGAAAGAEREGMWRLMPPRAVAEAVWSAYHEDKIHWYVPPELIEFDTLATTAPEAVRDQMAAALAARGGFSLPSKD
ncbi:MAG: SDR family oxidoreductase [Alphaproteobacteria bacterium]|nr:SDR family oxidoreductase [Alphaproteobacteria bacterium]